MTKKDKRYAIYEVRYNEETDSFETWVAVTYGHYPNEEDFGMEMSCKCMENPMASPDSYILPEDKYCMIHYSILKHIAQAARYGYEIVWNI
jgi:hypothetical protein